MAKSSANAGWSEEFLQAICRQILAAHLRLPVELIDVDRNLDEMGVDSIDGVLLSGTLSDRLKVELAPETFLQYRTISDVIRHLLNMDGSIPSDAAPAKIEAFYFPGGAGRENTAAQLVDGSGARLLLHVPPLGEWQEWIDDGCDLSVLTERCCEWIEARCPAGGVRLAGHSLGGQIAFSVALNLQERGRQVNGVYLFDSAARPHEMLRLGTWVLRRLKERAARILGRGPVGSRTVRDPADYGRMHAVMQLLDLKLARLLFRWGGALQPRKVGGRRRIKVNNAIRMKLLDLMWNRWAASLPPERAASLPVTLFRAQSPGAPDLGWSLFCQDLRVIEVKGNHQTLLEPPHVQGLANDMIKACQ